MENPQTFLETNISARFVYENEAIDPQEIASRAALTTQLNIVTQRLHTAMRLLIIELLDSQCSPTLTQVPIPNKNEQEGTDA